MTTPPERTALVWISAARFNYPAVQPGVDHQYGGLWGPRHDQRVSLHLAIGATSGVLYAYDPLWDEYAILQPAAEQAHVEAAFAHIVKRNSPTGVDVSELAQHLEAITRADEPRSGPLDVPNDDEPAPSGRGALHAPPANRPAIYTRDNRSPAPLAGPIDRSAPRREIEL